nr:hypothetical protein Iba_chr06dCG3380 [Ipomoea batatas]
MACDRLEMAGNLPEEPPPELWGSSEEETLSLLQLLQHKAALQGPLMRFCFLLAALLDELLFCILGGLQRAEVLKGGLRGRKMIYGIREWGLGDHHCVLA